MKPEDCKTRCVGGPLHNRFVIALRDSFEYPEPVRDLPIQLDSTPRPVEFKRHVYLRRRAKLSSGAEFFEFVLETWSVEQAFASGGNGLMCNRDWIEQRKNALKTKAT